MAIESKSLEDILEWLQESGFSESVIEKFEAQEMDGAAIAIGLASSPGPTWLKDVIPIVGTRLKVHNALVQLCNNCSQVGDTPYLESDHEFSFSPSEKMDSASCSSSTRDHHTPARKRKLSSSESSWKLQVSSPPTKVQSLPKPFPIPVFRGATEANLEKKLLVDTDRKYMVQVLSTVLMVHVQRPSLAECGVVAKQLISKYPFLNDDEGDGEHSWKWFIYNRCYNVNRKSAPKDGQPRKKAKKEVSSAAHVYPTAEADDEVSYGRNLELLNAELAKSKPRSDVLKQLMMCTFSNRQDDFVNGTGTTLSGYIKEFPLLKKATYALIDFGRLCNNVDVRDSFERSFSQWARVIIKYCRDTQIKSTAIQTEVDSCSDTEDEEELATVALRCLSLLFAPIKTKKLDCSIPYIMNVVPRGTPPKEASDPRNKQPHIVLFDDEEIKQFFIAVENELMMETNNIISAILLCLAAHYIFNLTYHPKTGDVWLFIQEKVLNLPSKDGVKKNPSTRSHFNGLSRFFAETEQVESDDN